MDRSLRRLKGVREKNGKIQVFVWAGGAFRSTTFGVDPEPTLEVVRAWQAATKKKYQKGGGGAQPAEGTFAADVVAYALRRAALPTIKQQSAHLALWVLALGGDRSRDSITTAEIAIVLETWLLTPVPPRVPNQRGRVVVGRLNPGTIRKRRTSLMSFYTEMNGADGYNPAQKVKPPKVAKLGAPKAIAMTDVAAALAAMSDQRDVKRGTDPQVSLAKIRATVLAYTGIPPHILKQLRPCDLLWRERAVNCPPRLKGDGGSEPRVVPLTDDGLAAFREFDAANAFGPFATQSVNRAFQKGARTAGLDVAVVHLYVLRHSFLTALYRATKDAATVGRFALHAENSPMTLRYTRGAFDAVDAAAAKTLSAALVQTRRDALRDVKARKPRRTR